MMYTMPKNLLSICVNFALATQRQKSGGRSNGKLKIENGEWRYPCAGSGRAAPVMTYLLCNIRFHGFN